MMEGLDPRDHDHGAGAAGGSGGIYRYARQSPARRARQVPRSALDDPTNCGPRTTIDVASGSTISLSSNPGWAEYPSQTTCEYFINGEPLPPRVFP